MAASTIAIPYNGLPPAYTPPPQGFSVDYLELLQRVKQTFTRFVESSIVVPFAYSSSNTAVTFDVGTIQEHLVKEVLRDTIYEIRKMRSWGSQNPADNDPLPNPEALQYAESWLAKTYLEVSDLGWIAPNVTLNERGEVEFDWWYNGKMLTVIVGSRNAHYLKVQGPDMIEDMFDGDADLAFTRISLWKWLVGR